jgi:hypothetical protein
MSGLSIHPKTGLPTVCWQDVEELISGDRWGWDPDRPYVELLPPCHPGSASRALYKDRELTLACDECEVPFLLIELADERGRSGSG